MIRAAVLALIMVGTANATPRNSEADCQFLGNVAVLGYQLALRGEFPDTALAAFKEEFPDADQAWLDTIKRYLRLGAFSPANMGVQTVGRVAYSLCMAPDA